jgi:UDP-glucose:tetrahydrobiopterin glucosyltransferase
MEIPNNGLMRRRIAFISTPVSPLGSGDGGGVETTLRQLTAALAARGHDVSVIAPAGSVLGADIRIYPVSGSHPRSATVAERESQVVATSNGVLERMWEQAMGVQQRCDVIIAMTYDWLSYYLTTFFPIPVLHWVTLPSSIAAVDTALAACYANHPDWFVFYSRPQAATFPFVNATSAHIIPGAVDTECFQFRRDPEAVLAWVARISPEKGLEDAVMVAESVGMPLHVCGKIQDRAYWEAIRQSDTGGRIVYHGMLPHDRLQEVLGRASASLVTPKWVEAFGLTAVEALACGTPVVAYAQGGPGEIVEDGKSGFLVAQDDVAAMARAVERISTIERWNARRRAENYSVERMAERVELWVESVLAG